MTKGEKRALDQAAKVEENRVRRIADALGLALQKSKTRNEYMPGYGRFRIARPYYSNPHADDGVTYIRNGEPVGYEVVAGGFPVDYGLTLAEAEAWLTGDKSADPIGFGPDFNEYEDDGSLNPALVAQIEGLGLSAAAIKGAIEADYPTRAPNVRTTDLLVLDLARALAAQAYHQKEVARITATLRERSAPFT